MQLLLQVNDWFTNWRARVWKREVRGDCGVPWRRVTTKVLVLVRTVSWYKRVCKPERCKDSAGIVVRNSLGRLESTS